MDWPSSPPTAERTRGERPRPPRAGLHFPVLIPGRVGADALARDLHVDYVRLVLARRLVDSPSQRRLELLQRLDGLAVDALGARQRGVVRRPRVEVEPGVLSRVPHLAVR